MQKESCYPPAALFSLPKISNLKFIAPLNAKGKNLHRHKFNRKSYRKSIQKEEAKNKPFKTDFKQDKQIIKRRIKIEIRHN